ncbi:MAG: DUF58 domain-containing protein [Alphaproteobacteria bacterium]|nr:DUF58 domain-containing protein [Alphaproteobacteria bacterium]
MAVAGQLAPKGLALRGKAEQLAAALPPLLVAAERVASTVAQGVHGRRRVGQGEAFWQFRRFGYGDSVQRIDWRQSAKSQYLYLRETEWEAAQSVWLWRDASPSMQYRSDPELPTKLERATVILLALMVLLVRGGERIALLGGGGYPATGRAVLNRLANTLLQGMVPSDDAEAKSAPSLPADEPLPRFGHVVMIGDFLSPLSEIDRCARGFAARGVQGHIVQVLDPAETVMPFKGRSRFTGLEAEGNLLVGKAEGLRTAYLERLDQQQAALSALARALGWVYTIHHTERPPQPALLALYTTLADLLGK